MVTLYKMASCLEAEQIHHLFKEKFVEKRKKLLAEALDFPEFDEDDDLRSAIILDIFYEALLFAVNEGLSWQHAAVVFRLIQKTLQNIADKTLPETIQLFQQDLEECCHFSEAALKSLVDYIFTTFFQHFKLHRYVLTCDRVEDRRKHTMVVEAPVDTPCLSQGIPKPVWDEKQRLKEIDKMEEKQKMDRQAHYQHLLEEAAKHLDIPFEELTINEQAINKETLTNIVKDVANAQALVTETLLQETLDEIKDTLEFQSMRANVLVESTEKTTRKKSGASSSKSKRK